MPRSQFTSKLNVYSFQELVFIRFRISNDFFLIENLMLCHINMMHTARATGIRSVYLYRMSENETCTSALMGQVKLGFTSQLGGDGATNGET